MTARSQLVLAVLMHAALVCTSTPGRAQTIQDLRNSIREIARETRYATFIATMADLAEDGELAGGSLEIDGTPKTNLTTISLPWRKDFLRRKSGHALHIEATLGYSAADIRFQDIWNGGLPGQETDVHSRYQAVALGLGIGPSIKLADGGILQPLLHGGLAYVHNDTDYGGPGSAFTRSLTDGILFNWDGVYGSYGGSLALRPKSTAFDDVKTKPLLRYDIRRTEGLHVDDPALDSGDTVHWATLRVDLSGPTGWTIGEDVVMWEAEVGYRYLFGRTGDVLGFNDYFEFGLGLGFNVDEQLPLLSELHLGAAIQYGEDVFGWSIGLTARF